MKKNIISISIIGNALEYYDYTLYAVFSTQISKLFFPKQDAFSEIFLALGMFAVGFIMRPIGSIIFGHIGDRMGRKKALTLSIACMAIPTFSIGLMPGYETLGVWASILLVLLRLVQGMSIAGEGVGSAIFILEHNKKMTPGYLSGIINASNFVGAFFATLVGLFIANFTSSMNGWRYAFILGGLLGFVGLYLRTRALETPIFNDVMKNKEIVKLPLLKAFSENKRQMLLSACLAGIIGAFAYMILAYINIFFNKIIGLPASVSITYAALGIGSYIIFLPLSGLWSDKVGHTRSMIQGCFATTIMAVPIFMLMSINDLILNIGAIITLGALGAWIGAPAYPVMLKIFPPQQRYSGMAVSFNVGVALLGGTAPIISAFLTKSTGIIYMPSFYLVGLALLYIGCYYFIYKPKEVEAVENPTYTHILKPF